MNGRANSLSDFDLKCDFPARESFRESLLASLLDMEGQEKRWVATAGGARSPEYDSEIRELTDSELEMLAAARGEPAGYGSFLEEVLPPGSR